MSVENAENANGGETELKPQNGDFGDHRLNGISNGHIESNSSSSKHKSSSKDKHRDKDKDYKSSSKSSSSRDKDSEKHKSSSSSSGKDKHRDKEKDRDRDKDRDKDKHKSSSSSSHKSSSRDKDKEKDREDRKDRDKEKDKSKDKDKERDKDRDKDKDRHRDKDKERDKTKDKERDKDKDKERSKDKEKSERDSDKDRKKDHKSSSSRDKDREKDKERSRDKDKEHKSSSSSKDKHSSSSSSSKSKDRDKEREKDKEKHSSSSSSKDKDRHRDKDRKDKDRHSSSSKKESAKEEIKEEPEVKDEIKQEFDETCDGQAKDDSIGEKQNNSSFYETKQEFKNEFINNSRASSCDYSMSQFRDDEPDFVIKKEARDDSRKSEYAGQEEDEEQEAEETTQNETEEMDETNDDSKAQDASTARDEDEDDDMPLSEKRKKKRSAPVQDDDDDDDMPLSTKQRKKRPVKDDDDSDEDAPLITKKKTKTGKKEKEKKSKKRAIVEEEDEYDEKPKKKKTKKEKPVQVKSVSTTETSPTKGRKKKDEEEAQDVWRWWEEEKKDDGVKWHTLEHKGPVFAPPYEPLPANVKFFYDGKEMKLSQDAEEIACFYAKMLNHDYVTKSVFNDNFFKDWRKSMTSKEKETIKSLKNCNFEPMHQYFTALSEKNKNKTKDEKQKIKEANEALIAEYGFCIIDGHKERIGNFKLEPPGLFRGRGEHPKMGLVKKRLMPEDIIINCGKDSKIPVPPSGHRWKDVRHDNSVTWLVSWTENVQGQVKYIMLNPSSKLKGEKDYAKYETARRLDKHINKIRTTYREEWKSKEMRIRQRAVALYFIDKLALRAGNEKDEDQADTVGCCSLRVEHIQLHKKLDGKENVVEFDFLGKDSIRYYNKVDVEKRVFKNLELFMENKKDGDDLFDRLNTSVLNEHLRDLMDGLTAKVFRTYNASITLQNQLDLLTDPDATIPEKLLAYNRANRAVAVLCNHQRSVPKGHEKSMENLKEKIRQKREAIEECENELYDLQRAAKKSVKERINADKKQKQLERLQDQLKKLELQETDRDENKTIALGTSKLNYLDPRISVAWCKKFGVPIEKIFNKTQRDKFRWAIHMADEDYRF